MIYNNRLTNSEFDNNVEATVAGVASAILNSNF